MPFLHTLLRLYPFWAVPLGLLLIEIGVFLKRRRTSGHIQSWVGAGFLLATSIAWMVMRGDRYSDDWLRRMFMS
ncbi:MAG: hypothetical protein IT285_08540 [Bdellovibrionales bacterium]|nr:hypothetical protein [Bdellovibrionales bacterium]